MVGWAVTHVFSMCYLSYLGAQLCVSSSPARVSTGVEPRTDIAAQTSSALSYWDWLLLLTLLVCFPSPCVFLRLTPPLPRPLAVLAVAGTCRKAAGEHWQKTNTEFVTRSSRTCSPIPSVTEISQRNESMAAPPDQSQQL